MTRAATDAPPRTTTSPKNVTLRRAQLTRDPGVQARAQLDRKAVGHYAALMKDGLEFPALTVFDDGEKLYLADGWHRDAAAELAGLDSFPCDVRKGTRRDAILSSVGANARHGLYRSHSQTASASSKDSSETWSGRGGATARSPGAPARATPR